MSKLYSVSIVPEYPLGFMEGGLQVQAQEICAALKKSGVDAELFNWSSRGELRDIYHMIGAPHHLCTLAQIVKEHHRKCICTLLFGSLKDSRLNMISRIKCRMRSSLLRSFTADRLADLCDAVTVRNESDERSARKHYRLPANKVHIMPVLVNERFLNASPALWHSERGTTPFVLCVGPVQKRKNQLLLIQACNSLRKALVIIGPVLPGEADYAKSVEKEMTANMAYGGTWIKGLPHDAPLLYSAYAASQMVALLSNKETQPASVLQAMAAEKPVLLANADYTESEPFRKLTSIDLHSFETVKTALDKVWNQGNIISLPEEHHACNITKHLKTLYTQLLQ